MVYIYIDKMEYVFFLNGDILGMYWGYIGWDYIWEYHGNMLGMVIQGRRGP